MKTKKYLLALAGIILFLSGLTGLKAQTVTDIDGNVYKTVTIGTQTWMAENLKTTRYNDGEYIPLVGDSCILEKGGRGPAIKRWLWSYDTTDAYCWYNNNYGYKDLYGALYNAYAVHTNKLCPIGWHVPTEDEWITLINYLGGDSIAGGKLKESDIIHWKAPNSGASNETGFTALPGGCRAPSGNFDGSAGYFGFWYSSTILDTIVCSERIRRCGIINMNSVVYMKNDANGVFITLWSIENFGNSIRCICDNITSGINYMNSETMILYPNPANDRLYFKNINLANTLIMIFDLQGKQVLIKQIDSESIDISNLRQGIYIVKLVCPESTVITKFIKE